MLTKDVINTINQIDSLNEQISQLYSELERQKSLLVKQISREDWVFNVDYDEITSVSITDTPCGQLQGNGSYVSERCDDSIYAPDSGSGTICWPIEDNTWLKIEYLW